MRWWSWNIKIGTESWGFVNPSKHPTQGQMDIANTRGWVGRRIPEECILELISHRRGRVREESVRDALAGWHGPNVGIFSIQSWKSSNSSCVLWTLGCMALAKLHSELAGVRSRGKSECKKKEREIHWSMEGRWSRIHALESPTVCLNLRLGKDWYVPNKLQA